MFTSNRTWFCKGLETEKAKEIAAKLNDAIEDGNHAEATELFNQLKKYMRKRIFERYAQWQGVFHTIEAITATATDETKLEEGDIMIVQVLNLKKT